METMNLDLLEAMGIEYAAAFVPFSQSRNKDKKDKSLNWKVTLKRNRVELTTDYMQGSGHVPIPKLPKGSDYWRNSLKQDIIKTACEKGQTPKFIHQNYHINITSYKPVPKPDLKEVLWSLLMDSDVLQHDSFESWASDLGYDLDSREAEKIYMACLKIALKINQMFTNGEMEQLREFYQDY